ncbi:uncharacterized protein [Chelonus insularis]|uniref:uncharacterized protein n=1 Tax=Chelonus insularis TaxID=460826 RepID=UPI00158F189B|nr:uncharacterized protein LOC118067668 [Chelonus insularis]XP_034945043.1 uncharacterized protein LOC118070517 [Chelonus insularis]
MEKSNYIYVFLIMVMPIVLSTPLLTTSESILEKASIESIIAPYIEPNRLDKIDINVFLETPSSFFQMKKIKNIFKSILDIFNNVKEPTISETFEEITSQIHSVINKLNKTGINLYDESNIYTVSKIINSRLQGSCENLKILSNLIDNINYLFKNHYLEYLDRHTSNASLNVFISKAMSLDADGPGKSAFMIEKILYSNVDGSLDSKFLEMIITEINNEKTTLCSIRQTQQQLIYNLYYLFATTELKAYIMVVSAYKLYAITLNDNYIKDFERVQAEHLERIKNYLIIFRDAIDKSSIEMIVCSKKFEMENIATQVKAINKLPKESDYSNNKVVTGVRFVIKNEILHLQIEEGKLIPNGQILSGSEEWIPIDDMNYADRTIYRNGHFARMHQCIEYHSVTSTDYWHLSDVIASPNFIVIGANLEVYTSESINSKIIYLRLKFAKVNITTAQLNVSQERYSDDLETFPAEFNNQDLNNDAKYVYLREVDTNSYDYIDPYQQRRTKKGPFIDLQAIYGNPRYPLMGIGTFNEESMENNIISLKAFVFNFSSLVDIN